MPQVLKATKYANLYIDQNSGIYYARLAFKTDGKKPIKKSLRTTDLHTAISALAVFLQTQSSAPVQIERISWHTATDIYITTQRQRPNIKPRALESIETFAEHARRLIPKDAPADTITEAYCRQWWAKKTKTCASRTANGALHAVRHIFSLLIENGYLKEDPSRRLERMPILPTNFYIPSADEFRTILAEIRRAPHTYGSRRTQALQSANFIEFLAYSGLRIEEARRLTWADITEETIKVPAIKHAKRTRTLYINPSLANVIETIRSTHPHPTAQSPLFTIHTPRKALENACKRLSIPHIRIHDLRHFFATTCIEQGIDIPTVAKWLGHVDGGALAMKVYGHLRDQHSKEQAARLKF